MRKTKPGPPSNNSDRAKGALLGLAVGDALGAPHENRRMVAPAFPALCPGPHRDMSAGGPFQTKAGQVTDDTQMATCLSESLRLLQRYDSADAAQRYVAWLPISFDCGEQTRATLELMRDERVPPTDSGRQVWLKAHKKPAANGSLMRTAPIGVFFARDTAARVSASLEDSAITHFDPRCQLACVVLNGSIAAAVRSTGALKPQELVAASLSDLAIASAQLGRTARDAIREVQEAGTQLREDLALAERDDPLLYGPDLHLHTQQGFVRVALRLAYWELFHAPSFEAALVDVINRGGDTDTNGAITGALLGALFGATAIPQTWQDTVLHALEHGRPHPFWNAYHPRHLLSLL